MVTVRCLICANEGLRAYVDAGLNKGLSAAGIAAGLSSAGGRLDPDVVSRHKKAHWTAPAEPGTPQPTKRDLAIMLRDRVADAVEAAVPRKVVVITKEGFDVEEVPFDILDKELAPALTMGLKAQATLDKRDATKQKLGLAAGYLGLQMLLAGLGDDPAEPVMIEDGLTVDGEFSEAD